MATVPTGRADILQSIRTTILVVLCLGAGVAGSLEIQRTTELPGRQQSPIQEYEIYAKVRPQLQGFRSLTLLPGGTKAATVRKIYGAQFALTPVALIPRHFPPPVHFYEEFLEGPPILMDVTDLEERARVVDVLEYVADKGGFRLMQRELEGGLLLLEWTKH